MWAGWAIFYLWHLLSFVLWRRDFAYGGSQASRAYFCELFMIYTFSVIILPFLMSFLFVIYRLVLTLHALLLSQWVWIVFLPRILFDQSVTY